VIREIKWKQNMKSSDTKASKCHLKLSSLMMIFYHRQCKIKFIIMDNLYTTVQKFRVRFVLKEVSSRET